MRAKLEGNFSYLCFGFYLRHIKTYVATAEVDFPKDEAVKFLTDVFGLELVRYFLFSPSELTNPVQLLADDFARNGFKVYAPELFEGDLVAPGAFTTVCYPL